MIQIRVLVALKCPLYCTLCLWYSYSTVYCSSIWKHCRENITRWIQMWDRLKSVLYIPMQAHTSTKMVFQQIILPVIDKYYERWEKLNCAVILQMRSNYVSRAILLRLIWQTVGTRTLPSTHTLLYSTGTYCSTSRTESCRNAWRILKFRKDEWELVHTVC